ncbi:hypothetical protein CYLTODRAFT_368523 [Cylindrobasidium torrendii FP15055 ss-10]|uniref:BTB domain-containing protein n=1 Tax=Cylindrobasidium torrendii FP15055 ss-10 TaxID=1314674 RepID=A0A0D7BMV2_9AGAR|nr:hypothetical protein CYLTODRAFT_368523 [Cylindrobasidium torrendii FP15055 ss-10]
MADLFEEKVDTTSAIKGIIDSYPYGNAILREFLQNSDDAGATVQIFTLDRRQHPVESLLDPYLRETQGPALLCENDSVFLETPGKNDWDALKTIHGSNKVADETKIGKYGQGFRSCYHITDNPHILSGDWLAIFEPHKRFTAHQGGGIRISISQEGQGCADQLSAFAPAFSGQLPFKGTVVRLPLRNRAQAVSSKICRQSYTPDDISTLFEDFKEKELKEVMLFLKNIRVIELREIDVNGNQRSLAKVWIDAPESIAQIRSFQRVTQTRSETFNVTITCDDGTSTAWRICHLVLSNDETEAIMSQRLKYDVGSRLRDDKLFAHVGIAYPLNGHECQGRLFTRLPLPIPTNLPVHIHGILALTADRQALKNRREVGPTSGTNRSRERLLVEWNLFIFEVAVPRLWTDLLAVLVENKEVDNVWQAWPDPLRARNMYWEKLPVCLVETISSRDVAVFPRIGVNDQSPGYVGMRGSLFERGDVPDNVLQVLATTDFRIVHLPPKVSGLITKVENVSQFTVHQQLKESPELLDPLDGAMRRTILEYLLGSDSSLRHVLDIPLVATVDNHFACIERRNSGDSYILCTEDMVPLFAGICRNMVCTTSLPPRLLTAFRMDSTSYNMRALTLPEIRPLLDKQLAGRVAGDAVEYDLVTWLCMFWQWVGKHRTWIKELDVRALLNVLKPLPLVPLSNNRLRITGEGYLHAGQVDTDIRQLLEACGVPFSHEMLVESETFLRDWALASDLSSPEATIIVVDSLDPIAVAALPLESRRMIQAFLCACDWRYIHASPKQLSKLQALPVFLVLGLDSSTLGPLLGDVVYVKDRECPRPYLPNKVFVDVSDDEPGRTLVQCINRNAFRQALSEVDILKLAIENLEIQPPDLLDKLIGRILPRVVDLPQSHLDRLWSTPFVEADDGSRHVVSDIIDPESPLLELFASELGHQPAGIYAQHPCSTILKEKRRFSSSLTPAIVQERRSYISSKAAQPNADVLQKSRRLIELMDADPSLKYECLSLSSCAWIATVDGRLCSPDGCRGSATPALFDRVLPLASVNIRAPRLRAALGWDAPPPFAIVLEQLQRLLEDKEDARAVHSGMCAILRHFGKLYIDGTLNADQVDDIQDSVRDRMWVPTEDFGCTRAQHAAILPTQVVGGSFKRIKSTLKDVVSLLEALGCERVVSLDVLLEEINRLSTSSPDLTLICNFLREIISHPSFRERLGDIQARLMVPIATASGVVAFRSLSTVHYDDTPNGSPPHRSHPHRAHDSISKDMADGLGIPRASALALHASGIGEDYLGVMQMREDFPHRIKTALLDYDVKYALNEIIANAIDAGATRFAMSVDERSFGTNSVLCPEVARFQGPALILYNDALFKETDFRGICATGRGGKEDDPDSIGKFGLGALNLFHFTDLPMILSGDKFMILDPSSTLLPRRLDGQPRTAVYNTISSLATAYEDQFAPFSALFGYNPSAAYMPGTIFRLPLRREESQLSSNIPSPIELLKFDRDMAASSVIFTPLERIDVTYIKPSSILPLDGWGDIQWTVCKTVDDWDNSRLDTAARYTKVHISITSEQQRMCSGWFIASMMVPSASVPPEAGHAGDRGIRKVLRSVNGLRFDVAFPLPMSGFNGAFKGSLFSMTRLPISTKLPMHINAPFALGADRRSIRNDPADPTGASPPDALYNRWILGEIIPRLYQLTLAHLPRDLDASFANWPRSGKDEVSNMVSLGFYRSLATTQYSICPTITGRMIKPGDAYMAHRKHDPVPPRVLEVLEGLANSTDIGIVKPPGHVASQIEKDTFSPVSPSFVQELLGRYPNELKEWVINQEKSHQLLESLLNYLLNAKLSVTSLPLLYLQDGSIATIPRSNAVIYYFHDHPVDNVFTPSQMLSHRYHHKTIEAMLEQKMPGVKRLDAQGIIEMASERLGAIESERVLMTDEQVGWIQQFWNARHDPTALAHLPPDMDKHPQFRRLPLISTATGHYVSIAFAQTNALLPPSQTVIQDTLWSDISRVIDRLDIVIVEDVPQNRDYVGKPFALDFLVEYMVRTGRQLEDLPVADHAVLASWMRTRVSSTVINNISNYSLLEGLRRLPIWTARCHGRDELVSADEAFLLPEGIDIQSVEAYLDSQLKLVETSTCSIGQLSFTNRSSNTRHSLRTLDCHNVVDFVNMPERLPASDLPLYHEFIRTILTVLGSVSGIKVPDGNGALRLVTELFDVDEVHLFATVLGGHQEYSVHREFRDLLPRLRDAGLRQNVDLGSLKVCARVIHDELHSGNTTADTVRPRAADLFDLYKTSPGLGLIDSCNEFLSDVRPLSFVPRVNVTTRTEEVSWEMTEYVAHQFGDVVAPRDVVLKRNAAVCWSQLALCDEEDIHEHLTIHANVFADITVDVVVNHLLVLVLQVAADHSGDLVLLEDIKETYQRLDSFAVTHEADLRARLRALQSEQLFLNVDDPSTDPWQFLQSSKLISMDADMPTIDGQVYAVRDYLSQYRSLLRVADIGFIAPPRLDLPPASSSREDAAIRHAFDRMRLLGNMCDITFVPQRGPQDEGSTASLEAHSQLLGALSPYFETAFTIRMAEQENGTFRFPGSAHGAQMFLDFVYTGTIPLARFEGGERTPDALGAILEDLLGLVQSAHEWEMKELQDEASRVLISHRLCQANTYRAILDVAERYEATSLAACCRDFRERNAEEIRRVGLYEED